MMQQVAEAQYFPEIPIDENFETLEHQAVYGKRHAVTSGLTWGYYGGRWGGFSVADGTFTLAGTDDTYIVVLRADGVISQSTASTNWDNTTDYARVYKLTTDASVVTATEDHRAGPGGVHGGGSGGGGGGGGGSLTNFTESVNSASPNTSVPVVRLLATNAATHVDVALSPKGTGALLAHVPDGASTGGNKSGAQAVNLQLSRTVASQVPSGTTAALVGGSNNTASGVGASVVGGSGSTATQSGAAVVGGASNDATAINAAILGGTTNDATADNAACLGGSTNVASGQQAVTLGGQSNTADGVHSTASGRLSNARGALAARVHASGSPNVTGNTQYRRMHLYCSQTSDATQTTLTAGAGAASTTNQLNLPNNSAFFVTGTIVGFSSAGNASSWEFKCLIKRGASAAATALVGTATVSVVSQDASASAWAVSVAADTTNGTLSLKVTGEAATTIRWSAVVKSNEVVF